MNFFIESSTRVVLGKQTLLFVLTELLRTFGHHITFRGRVLVSLNCVFDASLVPETWRDWFVDLLGVMGQVPGASGYRTCAVPALHFHGNGVKIVTLARNRPGSLHNLGTDAPSSVWHQTGMSRTVTHHQFQSLTPYMSILAFRVRRLSEDRLGAFRSKKEGR
jgi:hypothetical protein